MFLKRQLFLVFILVINVFATSTIGFDDAEEQAAAEAEICPNGAICSCKRGYETFEFEYDCLIENKTSKVLMYSTYSRIEFFCNESTAGKLIYHMPNYEYMGITSSIKDLIFYNCSLSSDLDLLQNFLYDIDNLVNFSFVGNVTGSTELPIKFCGINTKIEKISVDLSFTNLPEIWCLRKLKEIKLGVGVDGNAISRDAVLTLPEAYFSDLPKLETIWLYNQVLKTIPENTFNGSTNIRHLYLVNNQLEEFPQNLLKGQTELTHLDLSRNSISKLESGFLVNQKKLKSVNLSHNQLANIPGRFFASQHDLFYLDLSFNKLKNIGIGTFVVTSKRRFLYLNNNELDFNDDHQPFYGSSSGASLMSVNLSNNSITTIPKGLSVPKMLYRLDLKHNFISNVSWTDLDFEQKKISINLSFNKIQVINKDGWDESYALQHKSELSDIKIDLSFNPLNCDCEVTKIISIARFLNNKELLTCIEPEALKGRKLFDIKSYTLGCSM